MDLSQGYQCLVRQSCEAADFDASQAGKGSTALEELSSLSVQRHVNINSE